MMRFPATLLILLVQLQYEFVSSQEIIRDLRLRLGNFAEAAGSAATAENATASLGLVDDFIVATNEADSNGILALKMSFTAILLQLETVLGNISESMQSGESIDSFSPVLNGLAQQFQTELVRITDRQVAKEIIKSFDVQSIVLKIQAIQGALITEQGDGTVSFLSHILDGILTAIVNLFTLIGSGNAIGTINTTDVPSTMPSSAPSVAPSRAPSGAPSSSGGLFACRQVHACNSAGLYNNRRGMWMSYNFMNMCRTLCVPLYTIALQKILGSKCGTECY
jgi:hypothetical protein